MRGFLVRLVVRLGEGDECCQGCFDMARVGSIIFGVGIGAYEHGVFNDHNRTASRYHHAFRAGRLSISLWLAGSLHDIGILGMCISMLYLLMSTTYGREDLDG